MSKISSDRSAREKLSFSREARTSAEIAAELAQIAARLGATAGQLDALREELQRQSNRFAVMAGQPIKGRR